MPEVSIIVPNYNHAQYLHQRFDSILNQTFQDFEVIILDDCSLDTSREIIEQYRNHLKVSHVIYNDVNSGSGYKQWYKGIEFASGELVWIAESDDWSDYRFLENLVPFFKDEKLSIAYSNSQIGHNPNKDFECSIGKSNIKYDGNQMICEQMCSGNVLFNASMVLFRKQKYLEVKDCGFTEMKLAGDYLLWVNLLHRNTVVHFPYKLNFVRRHETNTIGKYSSLGYDFIEGVKVWKKIDCFCGRNKNQKEAMFNRMDFYFRRKQLFCIHVRVKVLAIFFVYSPFLFFKINYTSLKRTLKRILKSA